MSQLSQDEKRDMIEKVQIIVQEALLSNDIDKINRMKAKVKRMGMDDKFIDDIILQYNKQYDKRKNTSDKSTKYSSKSEEDEEIEDPSIPKDEKYLLVEKILKTSDYYEILQVEKTTTVSSNVLKKKYRQLALKLHPDSNRHKKATEAFQKVNKAYDTLSDVNKKKIYDQFGTDDQNDIAQQQQEQFRRAFRGRGSPFFPGGFVFSNGSDDIHDEIFRQFFGDSFFGAQFGGPQFRRRRYPSHSQFEDEETDTQQRRPSSSTSSIGQILISIILFFALLVIPLLSNLMAAFKGGSSIGSEKIFSFSKTDEHPIHIQSYLHPKHGVVDYFISQELKTKYYWNPYYIKQIEDSIFPAYRNHLLDECRQNKQKVREFRLKAKKSKTANEKSEYINMAQTVDLSSCELLRKFGN